MGLKFYMPTKVLMGKDIIKKSANEFKLLGNKAFIITGKYSSKINGSLKQVIDTLNSVGVSYVVFDEIEENPSVETVVKASEIGKREEVDFIIGLGGGSPIDASKAIAVMIKNDTLTGETLFTTQKLDGIDVVAIPTTSGTGTETTQYSILTDHKNKTKRNLGQEIFPVISLLDASYTMEMGKNVTVNTAIDAMSHVVEGYLNTNANIITDTFAEKALSIWGECISSLISGEFDFETKEKLMLVSNIAGIIIAQTGTSLPHGMGYALTYFKNVPHGLANGCLYVEYLKVFKNREKVEKIFKLLGLNSHEELESILSKLIDVKVEITEDEINEYTAAFTANKDKLRNHPEEIGESEILTIYKNSLIK